MSSNNRWQQIQAQIEMLPHNKLQMLVAEARFESHTQSFQGDELMLPDEKLQDAFAYYIHKNDKELTQQRCKIVASNLLEKRYADAASHLADALEKWKSDDAPNISIDLFKRINQFLCSTNFTDQHVTLGSVLYSEHNQKYYLCITPACDMVPGQKASHFLGGCKEKSLLSATLLGLYDTTESQIEMLCDGDKTNATLDTASFLHSDKGNINEKHYIFIQHDKTIKVLSWKSDGVKAYNVYFRPIDHKNPKKYLNSNNYCSVYYATWDISAPKFECTQLRAIAQLRSPYAESLSQLFGLHTSRIGVDFIKANKQDKKEKRKGADK